MNYFSCEQYIIPFKNILFVEYDEKRRRYRVVFVKNDSVGPVVISGDDGERFDMQYNAWLVREEARDAISLFTTGEDK